MTEYNIQYVLYNCSQGGKPGSTVRCNVCNGRGIKVTLRQLGPGMVQQMQTVCPECRGEGELQPFVQHCLLHQCDFCGIIARRRLGVVFVIKHSSTA